MDLFNRYMLRQAGGAITLILLTLTMIVWIATALKQLELLTSKNQGMWMFFKVTLLVLPSLLAIIAPVALIISCLHVLNKANQDSELVIMTASGSTLWHFTKPFMLLGVIIMAFVAFSNVYLSPYSARQLQNYLNQIRTDLITQVLQPGKFSRFDNTTTIHIRARDGNGDILGLVIHDTADKESDMTIMANKGRIIKEDAKAYMLMTDGHIHRRKKGEDEINIVKFEKYLLELTDMGRKKSKTHYKPRQSYLHELRNPNPKNPHYKEKPGKFYSEFHDRISNPIYPVMYVFIIIAFVGFARTTREGRLNSVLIAFTLCVLLRILGIAAMNLMTSNPWAVVLLYGIPIGGILMALLIIHTRMHPSKLPVLRNIATS